MSSSRRHQGTAWGAWTLHPETNQYYRARVGRNGQYEYDYAAPPQVASSYSHYTTVQAAPRGDGVEGLTSNLSNFQLEDQTYIADAAETHDGSNVASAYTYSAPAGGSSYTSRPTNLASPNQPYADPSQNYATSPPQDPSVFAPKGKPKPKKKSRNREKNAPESSTGGQSEQPSGDSQDPFYEQPTSEFPDGVPGEQEMPGPAYEEVAPVDAGPMLDTSNAGYYTGQEESIVQSEVDAAYYHSENHAHHSHQTPVISELEPEPEPELEPQSLEDADTYSEFTTTSTTHNLSPDGDVHSTVEGLADPYATGLVEASSMIASQYPHVETYQSQGDPGMQTPRAQSPLTGGVYNNYSSYGSNIGEIFNEGRFRGGQVHEEDLWSRFEVQPSVKFQPGQVFKIYWSEPLGDGKNATVRSYFQSGEKFHYSFRRFIVVGNDEGHCTCVPILTYGHRACTKGGVKPHKHGIVYQNGSRPRMVDGEPELGFAPVRLELYERTEKLDYQSRVNYSKFQTIEHNYRVLFIGRIATEDFRRIVTPAVDSCWSKKKRQHR